MTIRRDWILVVAGVALGILIAAGLLGVLQVLSPGTGALPLSTLTGNGESMPVSEGIERLFSPDDVRKFITNHTEEYEETGAGLVPVTVPTTPSALTAEGVRAWRYTVDTTTFSPGEYIVRVSSITRSITASAVFNLYAESSGSSTIPTLIHFSSPQGSDTDRFFITIDPVRDHVVGETFTITGSTNLPLGNDEMLVEVVSSSFAPTAKTQTREFSGATGTIRASGGGGGGGGGGAGGAYLVPAPTTVPTVAATIALVDREYSRTNIQVKDVDEADIVKTDGTNMYVVSGNALYIVDAYPAETAMVLSATRFTGKPLSLYLHGDKIALICRDDRTPAYWTCSPGQCRQSPTVGEKTVLYIFSVKDPLSPTLEREVGIDGDYTNSRLIGDWLYFLTTKPVNRYDPDFTLPEIRDGGDVTFTPAAYSIEGKDKAFAFTTIGSVSLDSDAAVTAKSFLIGTAGTVYVSPDNLYIGIHSTGVPSRLKHIDADGREIGGSSDRTEIYSFSLDDGAIRFAAHGTVDGKLLNQYAMDEHMGNLRLATTVTESASWSPSTSSAVTVLDSTLAPIGRVSDIAPGERIYATRFMGERLYMVTFLETDPFFVVDLADPHNPSLVGKLKLPGFSNYLHPYDSSHIIGVGKTSTWGSVKLSLFDVGDITNPSLVDSVVLGESGSNSEVLNDPKAFLFDKEKDILVLPLHLRGSYETTDIRGVTNTRMIWGGAYVFSIDPSRGFSLKGTVQHYDEISSDQSTVKRTLYIEDTLYTISPWAIYMSDLGNNVKYLNKVSLG